MRRFRLFTAYSFCYCELSVLLFNIPFTVHYTFYCSFVILLFSNIFDCANILFQCAIIINPNLICSIKVLLHDLSSNRCIFLTAATFISVGPENWIILLIFLSRKMDKIFNSFGQQTVSLRMQP